MALRRIIPYGDTLLRRQSAPINEVDDEIKQLIADMTEIIGAAEGLGLAAPQVGVSKMLFIIDWTNLEEEGGEVKAYLNPRILDKSDEMDLAEEGCLSLPGISAEVKRPREVSVEYMTIDGESHSEQLSGLSARVFQHELDHLLGILFIDRISSSVRKGLKKELQAIMNGEVKPFDGIRN